MYGGGLSDVAPDLQRTLTHDLTFIFSVTFTPLTVCGGTALVTTSKQPGMTLSGYIQTLATRTLEALDH
ncbi:hypothetical protein E2C01_014979 [Portunus trituberculatus]|uniref:Uncharacterized protein n=1 Tax=Portunus trituberculatus TaxID=210409 RepID=A0A5B7DLC1_PORTR|nr:hypothetical protein [Portunus trituberculatus]